MRTIITIIIAALVGVLLAGVQPNAQTSSGSPPASAPSGRAADMGTISKNLGDEALRLRDETARGLKQLDVLERDLKTNHANTANAGKTVDELLSLLDLAAGRLSPAGAYVKMLNAQEATVRDFANRAGAHSNAAVRKMAEWFTGKADEIAAIQRDAEQLRTRLMTQIDRLEEQKEQLEYAVAATQVEEFIKNARAYLDTLSSIANGAKSLADNLGNAFGTNRPTQ